MSRTVTMSRSVYSDMLTKDFRQFATYIQEHDDKIKAKVRELQETVEKLHPWIQWAVFPIVKRRVEKAEKHREFLSAVIKDEHKSLSLLQNANDNAVLTITMRDYESLLELKYLTWRNAGRIMTVIG